MIFLYFEDWTQFVSELDRKGYAHGDKIIKVFATPFDPRVRLDKPGLKIIESDDSPLNGLIFSYEGRGSFTGDDIEKRIASFDPYTQRVIRGLVRFDNRSDLQFAREGMSMKHDGEWLITNPIEDLDGIRENSGTNETTASRIHLDIFEERSLKSLADILETKSGSPEMLELMKGHKFRMEIQTEISGRSGEKRN